MGSGGARSGLWGCGPGRGSLRGFERYAFPGPSNGAERVRRARDRRAPTRRATGEPRPGHGRGLTGRDRSRAAGEIHHAGVAAEPSSRPGWPSADPVARSALGRRFGTPGIRLARRHLPADGATASVGPPRRDDTGRRWATNPRNGHAPGGGAIHAGRWHHGTRSPRATIAVARRRTRGRIRHDPTQPPTTGRVTVTRVVEPTHSSRERRSAAPRAPRRGDFQGPSGVRPHHPRVGARGSATGGQAGRRSSRHDRQCPVAGFHPGLRGEPPGSPAPDVGLEHTS